MSSKKISAEIKEQVLGRVRQGVPVLTLSQEHGISTKTIYGWLSRESIKAPSFVEYAKLKRERDELLKMVGQLTLQMNRREKN